MKKIIVLLISILFIPTLVNAETKYLYDVLKEEVESNGLAKEYTGDHHDSFTEEPSKKIYHWYAENDEEGNQVLEKNNVIFANQCWQIIRTTDTGGVKLLYNGEIADGKCLNNRGSHVGYYSTKSQALNDSYYYGTSYEYNSSNRTFSLSGTITTGSVKIGQYTCLSTSSTGTCNNVYLIYRLNTDGTYEVMTLNNNANYSTIGSERFNIAENTLADVGYMYNKRYIASSWVSSKRENISTSQNLSINYWYADSVRWNTMTNTYELVDPYKVSSTDELSSLVGKYTFHNTREDYSNSTVRYISSYVVTYNGHRAYYIAISDGHDIDYYNDVYTFGTNYINNGDGTYTIVNPQTVTKLEYSQKNYYLYQVYVCKNAVNNTCSDLWYAHIPTDSFLIYMDPKVIYRVAHGFTYSNGKYHLTDDPIDIWDFNNNATETINNHRYTCFNETGECEKVYYIYDIDWFNGNGQNNENKLYFIGIEDGKDVETAMDEMLYNDEVNTYDSVIKTSIESWYEKELLEYDNNIEDIVYCGDRSTVLGLRGWDPDGSGYGYLIFKGYRNNDELSCTNVNDQFSTSNSKAKIKYKVSLPSSQEMHLLGNSKIYNTGTSYWLMSPYAHTGKAPCNVLISSSGSITYNNNSNWNGVRPMISLKPNTIIKSGDGTKNDPYTIDLIQYYNINVIINNETEDLKVEIDDLTHVEEGETVNFKVTPIKGRKVISIRIVDENDNEIDFSTTDNKKFTFTMPASNVTIIPSYERVKNAVNVEDNINTKEFVIEVNDSRAVVYEDTVRFRIDPEEGYEVEKIDITDEENNKINYKKTNNINEYEFTMPDTNVLIKPYYKKISTNGNIPNPNTKRQILLIVLSLLVLGIMTIIFVKKKKRLN